MTQDDYVLTAIDLQQIRKIMTKREQDAQEERDKQPAADPYAAQPGPYGGASYPPPPAYGQQPYGQPYPQPYQQLQQYPQPAPQPSWAAPQPSWAGEPTQSGPPRAAA